MADAGGPRVEARLSHPNAGHSKDRNGTTKSERLEIPTTGPTSSKIGRANRVDATPTLVALGIDSEEWGLAGGSPSQPEDAEPAYGAFNKVEFVADSLSIDKEDAADLILEYDHKGSGARKNGRSRERSVKATSAIANRGRSPAICDADKTDQPESAGTATSEKRPSSPETAELEPPPAGDPPPPPGQESDDAGEQTGPAEYAPDEDDQLGLPFDYR